MSTYLGQNFLVDTKVKTYIADKIKQIYENNNLECIIEIGPGKGAITKKIHDISNNFFVIEKDETMKGNLEGILNKEQIIFIDILKSNIDKELNKRNIDPKKTLVVGNLPYYITSPIFRKFFGNGEQKYFGGLFMIQEEVGQKIKTNNSPLGQKEGAGEISKHKKSFLRRLLNHSYNIQYKKTVGAKCFKPAPKVKSCLVEFQKKEEIVDLNFQKLFEFLDLYSQFSRKTLGAINKILQKQEKKTFPIPEDLKKKRLEELSWEHIKEII